MPTHAVYEATIPAGEPWMRELRKGQTLRILDLEGNQAADTLFYNAHDYEDQTAAMECLPDALAGRRFYEPKEVGVEKEMKERLERMRKARGKT